MKITVAFSLAVVLKSAAVLFTKHIFLVEMKNSARICCMPKLAGDSIHRVPVFSFCGRLSEGPAPLERKQSRVFVACKGFKGSNTQCYFGCSENKKSLTSTETSMLLEKKKRNLALKAMNVTSGTILGDVCQSTSVRKNHEIPRYVHLKASDYQLQ